jgi:kinetochore protein Spc24
MDIALARVLDAARTSSTRPPNVLSAEEHAKNLNHLAAGQLSLAKALHDAESAIASKQAKVSQLMEELRQLEESDPAAEHELDGRPSVIYTSINLDCNTPSTSLRLRIFRGLGIEPILGEDGNPDRVLVGQ